jgi:hypothetical protein
MRWLAGSAVLILILAACGGSTTETTGSAGNTGTTSAEATTTTGPPDATTAPDSTTEAPTASSGARFAIVRVGLGVLGQVVVQNVGDEAGSLAGYWLCQRPSYFQFPDVVVQPGEMAAISVTGRDDIFDPPSDAIAVEGVAELGTFDPASGEVGLYFGNAFDSADAIVSYVEWGNSGHGRSGTAVSAQIWPEGGFVDTSAETGAITATRIPPTDPEHWFNGGG